jgi:DNA-binding response OmpR family regulator
LNMAAETKTVVIVEDELDTAEMLAEMMRVSGFNVFQSKGGMNALRLIYKEKPDAVLLDIMLPDLSGLDLLQSIRRDPRLEKIPVIIVSAKSQPADIQKGLVAGANLYLTKPVGYSELRTAVEEVVFTSGFSN